MPQDIKSTTDAQTLINFIDVMVQGKIKAADLCKKDSDILAREVDIDSVSNDGKYIVATLLANQHRKELEDATIMQAVKQAIHSGENGFKVAIGTLIIAVIALLADITVRLIELFSIMRVG